MQQLLIVGFGGFAGAIARHVLNGVMHRTFPGFVPAGTLVVNALGCLAIGVLMALFIEREVLSPNARLLLITGFLGSLTTFSAFGYETFDLLRHNHPWQALLNVAANLLIGLAAVVAGYAMVESAA